MAQLKEKLQQSNEPLPAEVKPAEPPVWRLEEDGAPHHTTKPAQAPRRNLGRERQRDKIFFFLVIGLFLVVLVIVLWIAYTHTATSNVGV